MILSFFKYFNPFKVIDVVLDRFVPRADIVEQEKTKRADIASQSTIQRIKSKSWLDKWVAVLGYTLVLVVVTETIIFRLLNAIFHLNIPIDGEAASVISSVIFLSYGVSEYKKRKK